ncbi:hypothetical protein EBU71_00020 [bacterium]|jgi:hypothetical protein|nr:hypothetical protein [Candidatus Elulimicrobium humile]
MATFTDNLIAIRILYLLVTPFDKTKAFEYKIIDENGNVLRKYKDLTTQDEKDSYSYLHRLVFSLKRLLAKLPGGDNKLKSIAAAYYLIKEYYISQESTITIEERFNNILSSNITLVEEEIEIADFLLHNFITEDKKVIEDAPANVTGAGVSTDIPVISVKAARKYATFNVNDSIFNRFSKGKRKFSRWSEYLNLENESESQIYHYARKNPKGIIVLKNGDKIKAIRFNRYGGGVWNSIKRGTPEADVTQVVATEVIN